MADTITILNKYIDSIGMDIDKEKMKDIMKGIYIEATVSA